MINIPEHYKLKLLPETTEIAIKEIKKCFQKALQESLNLRRVTAPLLLPSGTGLCDNNPIKGRNVTFNAPGIPGSQIEIVRSLAKWKRIKLAEYDIAPGYGIYTVMKSVDPDVIPDNTHSLYIDQWDWEMAIQPADRNLQFLKAISSKIYDAILSAESMIYNRFPHITPTLPQSLTFIHAEDLYNRYPHLSPHERENEIAREHGAVFIIGLGHDLPDGKPHDRRAPDYDDWSSPNDTPNGTRLGLNGDIILWNSVLNTAMEVSSMGIRVDADSLIRQLEITGADDRANLPFHRRLLAGLLPQSIGGGIGQSRLAMFLLQKAHIGEVQASVWPEEDALKAAQANIRLI